MDEQRRRELLERNRKIIDMVIERARRDFPDDIAIIGLTGSFATDDFHEKSDLDLIVINDTERGWKISACFILDDVGFDIYCTPWETRIEAAAGLESPWISCLTDLRVLYSARPECLERFNAYRQRALDALSKPIGKESLDRARTWIDRAKQAYADAALAETDGAARHAAGLVLGDLVNALVSMNNTCFTRGVKRYREQIAAFPYLPRGFDARYMAVVEADTADGMRAAALALLRCVTGLHAEMERTLVPRPAPSVENLTGTYEELWCNYRNKVVSSAEAGDASAAFFTALDAQNFLDEMAETRGTRRIDVMGRFRADGLAGFNAAFMAVMDEYLEEYRRLGKPVVRYATFDELYAAYMAR
jgi:hypothetical protein